MSIFAEAAAALAADPHMGSDATYTAPSGSTAYAVRVVMARPEVDPIGRGLARTAAAQADIAAGALPVDPARGGTLVVDGVSYTVETPEQDEAGASWRLILSKA